MGTTPFYTERKNITQTAPPSPRPSAPCHPLSISVLIPGPSRELESRSSNSWRKARAGWGGAEEVCVCFESLGLLGGEEGEKEQEGEEGEGRVNEGGGTRRRGRWGREKGRIY